MLKKISFTPAPSCPYCGRKLDQDNVSAKNKIQLSCECGETLPLQFLEYRKYVSIGIVGVTGVGKTSWLTAMMYTMRNWKDAAWYFEPIDGDYTERLYKQNTEELYDKKVLLASTIPGIKPRPQIWSVRVRSNQKRINRDSVYSLTIYDGAGEDFEHALDPNICDYLDESQVLILLITPQSVSNDGEVVYKLAQYIRAACNIPPGKKIDKDVAIVFTEIDTVMDEFWPDAPVMMSSPHLKEKGFVEADADMVNANIVDWLKAENKYLFLQSVECHFNASRVRYFGVSSFALDDYGRPDATKSLRVEDPMIWALSKEKIIPVIKGNKY